MEYPDRDRAEACRSVQGAEDERGGVCEYEDFSNGARRAAREQKRAAQHP